MKQLSILLLASLIPSTLLAKDVKVASPDGNLIVTVTDNGGTPRYDVTYAGTCLIEPSALGLVTDYADFTHNLTILEEKTRHEDKTYRMTRTKRHEARYNANVSDITFVGEKGYRMTVTFSVSDNDVAYRYTLYRGEKDIPRSAVIKSEASAFRLPSKTTTFICPQINPMTGWERTKPSYEEEYTADAPMDVKSNFGEGYTFPCLFRVGDDGWVLLGETGVGSNYCASHISDYDPVKGYTIAFPNKDEMAGMGSPWASISIPGSTPWRTITVGRDLKPIVETTVVYDVVEPLYEPKYDYKPGRYTWSWIVWQDNSINYADQVKFIDTAAEMGYEYCLVDCSWDTNIGHKRIEELSRYAQSRGVRLMLWYNSNGSWNDAPQTPRNALNTSYARQKEMEWMKANNIAGIKVDFFGSDKQEMMRLYEDILVEANNYGLQVIFHGCTIPRGWERMYPNYVASEALLASENVYFTEYHAQKEAFELCMYPFSRNALGAADWGGVIMNRYLSRDNKSRHKRYTTDVFEMASAIVLQTSVNCVALCPNNLTDVPQMELDLLKAMPTEWEETQFVEGYPTRYVVIARRAGGRWYVGGLNAEKQPKTLRLHLPMLAGKTVTYYTDAPRKSPDIMPDAQKKTLKVDKNGYAKVTIQPDGGIIIVE